jgi:hypothetical protein
VQDVFPSGSELGSGKITDASFVEVTPLTGSAGLVKGGYDTIPFLTLLGTKSVRFALRPFQRRRLLPHTKGFLLKTPSVPYVAVTTPRKTGVEFAVSSKALCEVDKLIACTYRIFGAVVEEYSAT